MDDLEKLGSAEIVEIQNQIPASNYFDSWRLCWLALPTVLPWTSTYLPVRSLVNIRRRNDELGLLVELLYLQGVTHVSSQG